MTPAERLAIVSAELQRCDDLLATLWHVDTRAEVGHRLTPERPTFNPCPLSHALIHPQGRARRCTR